MKEGTYGGKVPRSMRKIETNLFSQLQSFHWLILQSHCILSKEHKYKSSTFLMLSALHTQYSIIKTMTRSLCFL